MKTKTARSARRTWGGVVALALWGTIDSRRHWLPFVLTLCVFLLTMVGLGISIWPDVIHGERTGETQVELLAIDVVMLVRQVTRVRRVKAVHACRFGRRRERHFE